MGKDSKSTASLEEAVETTTNKFVEETKEAIPEVTTDETPEVTADVKQAPVVAKEKTTKKGKDLKVKFLLSPTGRFGLGYSEGEEGTFSEAQANELVDAKYAEFVK